MSQRDLEHLFLRAVTWPTGIEDFLANADEDTQRAFDSTFAGTSELGAVERMNVYAEAYFYRLASVLREQFPVTAWLASDAVFHNLVTDYVLERPSRDPDIRRFGAELAGYITAHAVNRGAPFLAEVAEIEWSLVEAVDAEDEAPLRSEALAAIPGQMWPSLRFRFSTTVRLFRPSVDFPLLWEAQRERKAPADVPISKWQREESVVVWRRGLDVHHRRLAAGEAAGLTALLQGRTFEEACAHVVNADASAGPEGVASWLNRWLDAHMIVGVDAGGSHTSSL